MKSTSHISISIQNVQGPFSLNHKASRLCKVKRSNICCLAYRCFSILFCSPVTSQVHYQLLAVFFIPIKERSIKMCHQHLNIDETLAKYLQIPFIPYIMTSLSAVHIIPHGPLFVPDPPRLIRVATLFSMYAEKPAPWLSRLPKQSVISPQIIPLMRSSPQSFLQVANGNDFPLHCVFDWND